MTPLVESATAPSLTRTLRRAAAGLGLQRKGVEVVPGQNAGWAAGLRMGLRRPSDRITSPLNTYGGTDQASTWVFGCVTLRSQQLAGYPWWLHAPGESKQPIPTTSKRGEVSDLYELMNEPNDEMSYFDFAEQVQMDVDLAGNSWWLLDERNALGQPNRVEWMQPGTMKVAVSSKTGRRIGYVYEPPNKGVRIPYGLDEVMHFRNRNPLNRYYGMGVVEAILRAIDSDLSQAAHVTAFFDQGAHLSGVLTLPETLGEEEFERLKRQYQGEFADSSNSFRVLIAEGADAYTPISQGPAVLGVVDLRRASKDEILSGFGVPEFLLGGTGQGGVYKMEEAQNILHRAMIPQAGRFARRLSMDLAGRYVLDSRTRRKQLGFHVDPRQSDTPTAKVERSRKMVGTGATIDDMREMAGQDRLNWPNVTDVPLVPSGVVPVTKEDGFLPAAGVAPPPQPEAEPDPNDEPGGDGDSDEKPPTADGDADENKAASPPVAPAVPPLPGDGTEAALAAVVRDFRLAQRTRCLDVLGQYGAVNGGRLSARPRFPKSDLRPDLLDERAELSDLEQRLESVGLDGHFDSLSNVASEACQVVENVVSEGLRRGYSVAQVANGFPLEGYLGVVGIFDQLLVSE